MLLIIVSDPCTYVILNDIVHHSGYLLPFRDFRSSTCTPPTRWLLSASTTEARMSIHMGVFLLVKASQPRILSVFHSSFHDDWCVSRNHCMATFFCFLLGQGEQVLLDGCIKKWGIPSSQTILFDRLRGTTNAGTQIPSLSPLYNRNFTSTST